MENRKVKVAIVKSRNKADLFAPDRKLFVLGEMGAVLEWLVKGKDGKVREHQVRKAQSYVKQFLQLLMVQMMGIAETCPIDIRDTTGTDREVAQSALTFDATAPANNPAYGIQVGTGNAAPTINDCALQTQIAHGSGAGQMQYGGVTFGLPTSDAVQSHFTVTRDFANASGGTITIYEIGLVLRAINGQPWIAQRYSSYVAYNFLCIRDAIAAGINVLNGETLTVNYRQVANV